MASVTLADSARLSQDELVAGVIENIITVNRMYELLPFAGISGNALAYNRENTLGDVISSGVGTTFTGAGAGKNPATFTQVTSPLTTIMGDAEVNGMIQATRSNIQDQTAVQIASKAKSAGRSYQNQLINGTGVANQFSGLIALSVAGQQVPTAADGEVLSFALLDELLDMVTDKDGEVDYITMHSRTLRSYNALLRGLGGASIDQVVTLPSGTAVPAYRGVPILRNDYIPINQVKGASGAVCTTVFAGTFDDGSKTMGLSGLTAEDNAGIHVTDVGEGEDEDIRIWRVKWYCGLALFSQRGLAWMDGITN